MSKKNSISVINFSAYVNPEIVEPYSTDQPVKFGKDDQYFNYLIQAYEYSPTNAAIINSVSDMIYGGGLTIKEASTNVEDYTKVKTIFKNEDIRKMVSDFKLFGQGALQIIYSKDRSKITNAYHIPVNSLRAESTNGEDEIQYYYYSKDWDKQTSTNYKPVKIPAFGTSKAYKEILYIKPYKAGSFYYVTPDYHASLKYAELESEIANYHLSNILNGFAPSMLINFNNGQAQSDEEKKEIEKKVRQKFQGSNNVGNVILSFNDSQEAQTTIETIQLSDAANQYEFLSTECMAKLIVGHRVTSPALVGLNTNNGFVSNADEIINASIFFEYTCIRPFRNVIIDGLDKVLNYNEITSDLMFKSLEPFGEDRDIQSEDDKLDN